MDSDVDRRHSSPGFPHSDILGSRPACGFPRLIAASYVLLRLLMPGHSPYTLSSLTITLLLIHMVFHQDLFSCQRTALMIRSSAQLPRGRRAISPTRPPARRDALLTRVATQMNYPFTEHSYKRNYRGKRLKRSLVWWSWTELNRRPPACKAGALPTELQPRTRKERVCA